jgi:hypothetical protein
MEEKLYEILENCQRILEKKYRIDREIFEERLGLIKDKAETARLREISRRLEEIKSY